MSWTMVVSSKQVIDGGWAGEAQRLRSFLDVVSTCLETEYHESVAWGNDVLSVEQWNDLNKLTAEIERQRLRNDDGSLFTGGSSGSVVVARRGEALESMANNLWNVGGDGEWQFNSAITFYDYDFKAGEAKPLLEHPTAWLVHLISAASASVGAVEGRIDTDELMDEMLEVREVFDVGGLTLAPNGIGDAKLPASITAYPCPVGYPNGLVLVADMDRLVNDPASLVDDLLAVNDILKTVRTTM